MVASASRDFILLPKNDAYVVPNAIDTFPSAIELWGDAIFRLPSFDDLNKHLLESGIFMDVLANPVLITERTEQPVAMVMGARL